jgi:uric acid transporter
MADVHPVDERLSAPRLLALGLQHVLVMYAGAIAVPLIVGGALKLPKHELALLIDADLFCCGIATVIQSLGLGPFGIRMPVMMGVTFAAVAPMLAMAGNPALGITGIFGAVICAGIFAILAAPLVGRLLPLFPPLVTGTIIVVIGVSLMRVGIHWAAGGQPMIKDMTTGQMIPNPAYGAIEHLGVAAFVLAVVLLLVRYGRGFVANVAVLAGIVAGTALAGAMGKLNLAGLADAPWFDVVYPFQFGVPTFDPVAIATLCLVMIVVMIESTGMFLALSELTGRAMQPADLTRGLRTDGLGTVIGGVFNTFPYTSFSQNVGLVGVTGVRSRFVCVAGGAILIAFGLFPKLAFIAASIPQFVLGGAGIVMFGMVAATGIKILSHVDFKARPRSLYVIAISLGVGMIPLVAERFFQAMPKFLGPLLHSGILLAAFAAVVLNVFLNGVESGEVAAAVAAGAAREAEAH